MAKLWYVATTKTNHEHIAERELRKQGYQPFNPRVRVRVPYKTKSGIKERLCIQAFFPNYIFVMFDAMRDRWWPIMSTKGITSVIIQNELPVPVRPGVIETFIGLSGELGFLEDEKVDEVIKDIRVGDVVTIKKGHPFAGFSGPVTKMSAHDRIRIILEVFGRKNPVEVLREVVQ